MDKDLKNIEDDSKTRPNEESLNKEIEVLQKENENLKKQKAEDRFLFFIILIMLFNILFLEKFNNWGSSIIIGLLDILIIVVLGRRYSISDAISLLDKFTTYLK